MNSARSFTNSAPDLARLSRRTAAPSKRGRVSAKCPRGRGARGDGDPSVRIRYWKENGRAPLHDQAHSPLGSPHLGFPFPFPRVQCLSRLRPRLLNGRGPPSVDKASGSSARHAPQINDFDEARSPVALMRRCQSTSMICARGVPFWPSRWLPASCWLSPGAGGARGRAPGDRAGAAPPEPRGPISAEWAVAAAGPAPARRRGQVAALSPAAPTGSPAAPATPATAAAAVSPAPRTRDRASGPASAPVRPAQAPASRGPARPDRAATPAACPAAR